MIVVLLIAAALLVIVLILLFWYYMIYETPEKVSLKSLGLDETDISTDEYGYGTYDEPHEEHSIQDSESSLSKEGDWAEFDWKLYRGDYYADYDALE